MTKSLVIVESPAKEKTINKILGSDYKVKASMGHVKDLPKKDMGVDVNNSFIPQYVADLKQKKVLKDLKGLAASSDTIYIATDPDREGEAIGWHIASELKTLKKPIYRVVFNEITKSAVTEAIAHPGQLDEKRFNAQQARRIMDRLVGYEISPVLWRNIRGGKSAGRVQSVAVRLICEREEAIQRFVPQEYWSLLAHLKAHDKEFDAKLIRRGEQKIGTPLEKGAHFISSESEIKNIVADLAGAQYQVSDITKKRQLRNPSAPFITSTLQQDASRKLGFTASRTMRIAQELYEGIEIGNEGIVGLITYMRTDSTRISGEAISLVRNYIKSKYGDIFLDTHPRQFKGKKDNVQDAHEAIRPTGFNREPDAIKKNLSTDQYKLYKLIWDRFVACQMKAAEVNVTSVDISAKEYIFRATGTIITFPGFLQVYIEAKDDEDVQDKEGETQGLLPDLEINQNVDLIKLESKQHTTEPPPRYNEATLVKDLEERGIGRPSTYAAIIDTITTRKYVSKLEKRFYPTVLGQVLNRFLIQCFPEILNVKFTAHMEDDLDEIEDGKMEWGNVLQEFYDPFKKALDKFPEHIKELKKNSLIVSDKVCEQCGNPFMVRFGSFGSAFMGCIGYPDCSNTLNLGNCDKCGKPVVLKFEDDGKIKPVCSSYYSCKETDSVLNTGEKKVNINQPQLTGEKCPKCASDMVVRIGKYGPFVACSNYPKCKYIKPSTTGVKCPQPNCTGDLIERVSKRGKFYGCSNYPKCKFILSYKPILKPCPVCGAPFVIEVNRKTKKITKCYLKECTYSIEEEYPSDESR